jgi:zinc carboxypeptidase
MTGLVYSIGTPGKKWEAEEKVAWLANQTIERSYLEEVVTKLEPLKKSLELVQYGALSYDVEKYPLYAVKSLEWDLTKPTILVTGGVHGYETSGVHGAIKFLETEVQNYSDTFNIVVAPCVSPWGYEIINRWNPNTVDPNRSFYKDSPSEESAALMQFVASLDVSIMAHIDLHETTDSDESEFRPALAARNGIEYDADIIPDGFYLVGDAENPMDAFQKAIIESVRKVTHIAPADADGNIIGEPITQEGVINYATKALGLCSGFTDCTYATTTEVYPDSPLVNDDECNNAQVAAITGALNYIKSVM